MNGDRIVKGIWIPIEIWEDRNLSWNEKILLMEIDSLTSNDRDCFFSNEYIQNLLGVSERSARLYVSNLQKNGYITVTRFDGRTRFLQSNLSYCRADRQEIAGQGGKKLPHTNINIINKEIDKSISLSNRGAGKFIKPSVDDVRDYCEQHDLAVDPEAFWNFYESKGWLVGKSPMKSWTAALHTWAKRPSTSPSKPAYQKESLYEHNMRVMKNLLGE